MNLIHKVTSPFEEEITMEYCHLMGRCRSGVSPFYVPHVHDLVEETLRTVTLDTHNRMVQEAVATRQYELYGMEKKDFVREALAGDLYGFEMKLPIKAAAMQDEVINYIIGHSVSYTNYDDIIVNYPALKVW